MAAEITETGTGGLRGLPGLNQRNDILDQIMSEDLNRYNPRNNQGIGIQAAQVGYGDSQYDNVVTSVNQFDNLNDVRYNEQPWYDVLANSVGKMLGTAATTFMNSTIGMPVGLYTAAKEGRWSGLWDNEFTQGMGEVDDFVEKSMTNYKSEYQQENPWWDLANLGSMTQIGDGLIKNAGFMLGAAAAGTMGAGGLGLMARAMNFVNKVNKGTSFGVKLASSLLAATGEGMIEARQGVEERNKLLFQQLDDEMNPEYSALAREQQEANALYDMMRGQNEYYNPETGRVEDPAYTAWRTSMDNIARRRQELDGRKKAATDEILQSGRLMGNKILLGNQILLSLGNFIQFGKAFAKSFDNARHVAQTVNKAAAPSLASAVRAGKEIADGWKIANKNLGRLVAGTKGLVTEGSEEMNQQWLSSSAGAYYNREDVNDYWKARLDPDALKDVSDGSYSIGHAIGKGWDESWGDPEQWEQFVIGAITGGMGTVMPTKVFNQDKSKSVWNPMRYLSWEGGAYNEIKEYNDKLRAYESNINDLNNVVKQQDFASRFQRLGAHTALQNLKAYAELTGDKKLWKDADDKQTIHDIQAFVRAGKVDDLKSLYQELGADLSDAELDKLINDTSWDISAQQDKENHVKEVNSKISEEQEKISSLQQQMNTLDRQTEQSKDNAEELAKIDEQRRNLRVEMAQHSKNIGDLTQDRDSYEGKASKGGVFLTEDGNLVSAREKIRETIRHNIEELDRKLDSYLESVKQVQDDTGGRLTKDQEDNLAYLHNMGKESEVRFKKIMADKREDMPKRFLLKTNKTPEQLTQQYVASDLSFEVDSTTPDGYVEVDTTKMDDNTFASFFMTEVMWGGNISPEFGETAEEKEQREKDKNDKSLSDEERKKRAMERFTAKMEAEDKRMQDDREKQQASNWDRMRNFFIENYRKNNNATVEETRKAWKEIVQSVRDASDLLNQASQYRVTLSEYMNNPQKIDEDKKKAEEKLNKSKDKEQVKGMSINDLTDRDDLDELLKQAEKEKDIDLINKIRKAKVLRNKRASIEAAENDESKYKDLDPADRDAAFEILRRQVENDIADDSALDHEATMKELADQVADVDQGIIDDYIDTHAIVNIDTKTGKKTLVLKQGETNPAERAQLAQFETDDPNEYEKQRDLLRSKLRNIITPMDLELRKVLDKIINVDDIAEDAAQAQAQAYTNQMQVDENFQDEQPEKKDDRNNPVQVVPIKAEAPAEKAPVDGIGESGILDADMQQGITSGMQTASDGGQYPWYSVSGRVGYHTNESYSDTLHRLLNDSNISEEKKAQYRKQLVRAVAVEEFLEKEGAYTRVENGEVQRGTKIRFKVFKSVNEKAKDFVIFMVDDKGRVLADLPSSDPDIDPNTEKRTGLTELYKEARRQFLDSGADEVELQGIETEADNIYIGKPQYQDERQTLDSLFGDNNFTIALKVADASDDSPRAFLDTGKKSLQGKLERDAIKDPLTGSLGQPYVLIPTSQAGNKRNFKRGYVAVPIATPTFGELDQNSIFYRTVRQTLEDIRDDRLSETEAKTKLGELFGLANFHVNFDSKDSRKGAGIRATTYIRQDGSEKGAPHTLHIGDRASMDVDAILGELGRFFINIANSRINSNGTYTTVDGKSYTYNQMIGKIATTNAARPHTVNDWFTIRPVEKNGNKWEMSKTPTPRIPYPSGSKNSVFNVSVQYKDGTSQMWTISPQDWVVRDEKGRAIYKGDSVHSDAEVNTAAIHMALAFGRYYMKPMDRPYAIQVGNRAMMFDPTTNTFKTAKELEESPKYRKGTSFNSLDDEYNYLVGQEDDRIEGFEMAKAQKAAQQASQVSPQQIGQDMATHLKEMGVDVELVDDATKAAENAGNDAQLLALGEQGARNLDLAEEATTRMGNLAVADEMEKAGKDALAIKLATGWERGADNKWRYEIPDFVLNAGLLHILINAEKPVTLAKLVRGYYNHKDENAETLFNAYNKIKNAKVIFSRAYQKTRRGSYDPDNNTITIYPAAFGIFGRKFIDEDVRKSIEETLVHEIQHAIQEIEGFQPGTNLEEAEESLRDLRDSKMSEWNNLIKQLGNIKENYRKSDPTVKKYFEQENKSVFAGFGADVSEEELNALRNYYQNLINNDAKAQEIIKKLKLLQEQDRKINSNFDDFVYSLYYRAAGEAEARAISARHSMTDEERKNTLLTDTIYNDVAEKDLRFLKTASKALDVAPQSLSEEMQEIKAKAQADGTFMKAPNGNPTNLTERQWLQVRTKNFIRWFGDWINDPANASKVVDENGEPLVVYHYSDNETLTEFSTDFDNYFSQSGGTKKAIFFTEDNPNEKERGSNFLTKRKNKIAAFLNIKDLKTYKGTKEDLHNQGTSYREVVNKSAEENDVDGGVHMEDFDDNKKEHQSIWIVHNPNQVKSATDNNGEFSNENPNINMLKVNGKILGFEYNGKLYLQKDAIDPNLPMHEYTHLWDKVIKEVDPRLWNRGKELMKTDAADLWKQIAEDANYGKRWKKEGKTAEEFEDLIASEVHARLAGNGFEEYTRKHPTGTFAQLKQWLLDAFKSLARTLGMTDEQIEKLTLADFNNMTVRDFMEKSGPKAIQEKAANIRNSEALVERIKSDSSNYVLADADGNENPNGAYYKDNRTGQLYARVTSIKEGDTRVQPFNETDSEGKPNPWILPSTSIGNAVDEFVRAFFAGEDPETSPLSQNLSDATKKHLKEELQKIRTSVEKGGWKIVSNGIVASDTILVKDANGDKMAVRVAGTLDLFLYNPERDEYAIYDMKTHRSPVDGQKEIDWAAQLSLYKQLLETKFPELRGKIKGLRILPFSTSGYDALKQNYESDTEGRLTSNGNVVKAEVKYDGKTIDLTGKEMNLDISFARPGFKKEYVEGEGAQKIVVNRPQPKTGEATKEKVKEGLVKTINKIAADEPVKDYIKSAFKKNSEAQALAEKIDIARKDGSLGDLCLTAAEMSLLQDMLNERKINSRAAFEATKGAGIETQEDNLPNTEVAEEEQKTVDDIATEKGILNSSTKNAWNRLTDENKEKVVKLRRGIKNVKEELKNCQRLGKDPNAAISGYLHRKADETSGYTMIDMKKEMTWLDRVLPQLSSENKIRIIEGLIKCSDGTWSYGQMKNNLIYLASKGKEGTVYHEAFHAITQWILTDEELDRLYEVAKARYGNLDIVTLEEKLADDFMLYTMGLEPSYKRRDMSIFKRLWQAIRNMFRNTSMIDKLYRDINDGIYADRVLRTEGNVFSSIGEEDRQVSMKYNFLDKEQKQRLKDGGVSKKQYEVLDTDEKRYLFHCVL